VRKEPSHFPLNISHQPQKGAHQLWAQLDDCRQVSYNSTDELVLLTKHIPLACYKYLHFTRRV